MLRRLYERGAEMTRCLGTANRVAVNLDATRGDDSATEIERIQRRNGCLHRQLKHHELAKWRHWPETRRDAPSTNQPTNSGSCGECFTPCDSQSDVRPVIRVSRSKSENRGVRRGGSYPYLLEKGRGVLLHEEGWGGGVPRRSIAPMTGLPRRQYLLRGLRRRISDVHPSLSFSLSLSAAERRRIFRPRGPNQRRGARHRPVQRYGGNIARLAHRSDEALGVRVSVAPSQTREGAAVAEWLDCSPPTQANRAQFPAGPLWIFVSGDRAGRRVSLDISLLPPPCSLALLHSQLISLSSALKTSIYLFRRKAFVLSKERAVIYICAHDAGAMEGRLFTGLDP
ncbi:hypothetical protein PR048_019123 [Dryococelus australis]|uniref:Uncharacterized protein n=1 Tax=Dryococelus australis TaxID=614101 RepID=A0ABQ9H2P4_9NEOP|nr:hypothetical protein PR048_019123 [Dryococelus australis]